MKRSLAIILGLGLGYAQFGMAADAATTTTTAAQPAAAAPAQTTAAPATAATTQPVAAKTVVPTVDKGKASYSIGVDLGTNFKSQGIEVDTDMLAKGLKDALSGGQLMMTKQEMVDTLTALQKQLVAKQQATFEAASQKNEQTGKAFLEANKSKPGVVTTPSGLQYKVVKAGTGATPKDTDIVTVNYEGQFIDGKVFDSSYKRGKPVTFPVNEVISGWTEALKLMQPGATYEIYVPSQLAYGDRGLGNIIGPKQTLIFKVDLLSVKAPS